MKNKETLVCKISNEVTDEAVYKQAGEIIRNKGLVAFPTETVYGLGGDAFDEEAAAAIYAAKGRPSDNPLIVHIADKEDLYKIAASVNEKALALADAFWPGPLTIILPKGKDVPYSTTGGLDTVAVRMPSHPVALEFIKESGRFIAAPSANTSGRPSPTKAEHVAEDLTGKIDMIIDGGTVNIGLESTIVDLSEDAHMILRPGYITKDMLEAVIGEVKIDPGLLSETGRPKAPGMRYRHYAPKAPLTIISGKEEMVVEEIKKRCAMSRTEGKKTGVIATIQTKDLYDADIVKVIGDRDNKLSIASHLYDVLRFFDSTGVDVIYSESFDETDLGHAIMNRLLKAAGHQIYEVKGEK